MSEPLSNLLTRNAVDEIRSDVLFEEMLLGYPVRILRERILDGLGEGVELILIDNGKWRFTVVPTRGMGIWQAAYNDSTGPSNREQTVALGWNSPIRAPVHPRFVPISEPSGLGWLSGFNEFMVRCGLESNGAADFDAQGRLRYPLHGRIANIPAEQLTLTVCPRTGEISFSGVMFESRLFFSNLALKTTYTTRAGSASLHLRDVVTNHAGRPGDFQMLYHVNLGFPSFGPGSKLFMPFDTLAPRDRRAADPVEMGKWNVCDPETPDSEEVVYYIDAASDSSGLTKAMLLNPSADAAFVLSYEKKSLPCFSFWKTRLPDGDGYACGLEPGTNFPNPRTFEKRQGRVVTLPPGGSHTMELTMEVLRDGDAIAAIREHHEKQAAASKILDAPRHGWSP